MYEPQKVTFVNCVSGQIYCAHTDNDSALVVFETLYGGQRSIGRNPQYLKDRHNVSNTLSEVDVLSKRQEHQSLFWFNFQNFDVSLFAKGHLDYRAKMDLILEHINFQT